MSLYDISAYDYEGEYSVNLSFKETKTGLVSASVIYRDGQIHVTFFARTFNPLRNNYTTTEVSKYTEDRKRQMIGMLIRKYKNEYIQNIRSKGLGPNSLEVQMINVLLKY